MKDYNSMNFKNNAIDRMSGKFGKNKPNPNDPTDPTIKTFRVLPKIAAFLGSGVGMGILASDKAIARREDRYKKRQEKKKEKLSNK